MACVGERQSANGSARTIAPVMREPSRRVCRRWTCGLLLLVFLYATADLSWAEDRVARGAYLAKVTGCEGCHSAHDANGVVAPSGLMAGGDHPIRGSKGTFVVPPNITPDPETGIGGWSVTAIVKAIRTGKTPGGRTLSIAMPWRTQYAALTDEDAQAIATYLLTVPAVHLGDHPN